jgi:hypothetical protein
MLADEKQRLVRSHSSPLPRDISLSTDRRYALSSAKQMGMRGRGNQYDEWQHARNDDGRRHR